MKGSVPEAESGDPAQRCRAERGILGLLVGDNVYDVSDMKTKIEGRFGCIHLMGGLCGYDTRKQAVYYSSPESRKLEEEAAARDAHDQGRLAGQPGRLLPRTAALAVALPAAVVCAPQLCALACRAQPIAPLASLCRRSCPRGPWRRPSR